MMKQSILALALLTAALAGTAQAQEQEPPKARRYGVAVGTAMVTAPLGELAESYGILAVPGVELDARIFARNAQGTETSIGVIGDVYEIRQNARPFGSWDFEYASIGVVAGRSWLQRSADVSLRGGIELGGRYFSASSTRPDVYEGIMTSSDVTGGAALFAVTYALEVPSSRYIIAPRLRIETSYPDFGGGDGYSILHRESDLGFRASFGVELKRVFP